MAKKIVIAAGGTGGHLFPAQALAQRLQEESSEDIEILFMGKGLQVNPYFRRAYPYKDISSATFPKCPLNIMKTCYQLTKGSIESFQALRAFKPDMIIGFGSYHSAPVLAAGSCLSIPIILHDSNMVPGSVIKLFSRRALWTGVFFEDAAKSLRGETVVVDIPLRQEFKEEISREEALQYYGLDAKKKTLLIFGGSQGAKTLNALFLEALQFFERHDIQVLHFTGGHTEDAEETYRRLKITACVKDFEPRMHFAWQACDFCITRSGAVTIAEQLLHKTPALFIPYPFATDNHQEKNALFVEKVVKGAKMIPEKELDAKKFASEIAHFVDDKAQSEMKKNLENYAQTHVRKSFCSEVLKGL